MYSDWCAEGQIFQLTFIGDFDFFICIFVFPCLSQTEHIRCFPFVSLLTLIILQKAGIDFGMEQTARLLTRLDPKQAGFINYT